MQRITRNSWGKEAKEGFPKMPKTSMRGTRDSWEFSPRLDGQEPNHGVTKTSKRKLRSQNPPKKRKSIQEQGMNEYTKELLNGDLDFIQIHRNLQRNSPIQRARPPPIHPPSQICGPSYNLDHLYHGDLGLTLEQREEQGENRNDSWLGGSPVQEGR